MIVPDLIREAEAAGIHLWAEGSVLRYRGNPEAVQALLPRLKANKPELLAILAGKSTAPAEPTPAPPLPFPDDDILTHPERYEIVEFTEWVLPSGRRVAFKLAIPKAKYDGFELIKLLEQREAKPCTYS